MASKTDVTTAINAATANMAYTTKPTNFTDGLQSGGINVATAADLKSVEKSAWRQLDAAKITASTGQIYAGTYVLYKLDTTTNRLYLIFTVHIGGSVSLSLDFSNVVKHISTPSLKDFSNNLIRSNNSDMSTFGVSNNVIYIEPGYGRYYSAYSTYTVNGSPEYNFCFVNYDELA